MSWREKWEERWPDFKPDEILSPRALYLLTQKGVFPFSFRALDKLQAFRAFVGSPLLVNHHTHKRRGVRTVLDLTELNEDLNRDRYMYSFHLWCAFDLSSTVLNPHELYEYAVDFDQWGGIGRYSWGVHVDDRDSFGDVATWSVI
jgi:hypothetical protein